MIDAADATTGASVVRGAMWNAGARFAPQGFTLILSVVAARFLGPDGMGRQSFIAFVALSVTTLFSGGLSAALVRNVGDTLGAGQPKALRKLLRWAWQVSAALAIVGGSAVAAVGLFGGTPEAAWVLAGCACTASILHTIPAGTLAGAQAWKRASAAGLITGGLAVPTVIVVLSLGGGIVGIFAVEFVAVLVNLLWTTWLARQLIRELPRGDVVTDLVARTGRLALITTISTVISLVVWTRSEFFFLARYSSDAEIAHYSIAFAAQAALVLAITAATAVTLPAFATLVGAGQDARMRSGYGRATRLSVLASVPLCAAAFSLGPGIIALVYGEDYADTRPVLRILLLALPFAPLASLSASLLFAQGRLKAVIVLGASAAVLNLALGATLIPAYDAVGAAIANAGAQLFMLSSYLVVRRTLGPPGWPRWGLARVAAIGLATGAAGFAVLAVVGEGPAGLAAAALVESVTFLVLARVIGFLPAPDAAWLEGVAGSRVGPSVGRLLRFAGRPA